MGNKKWNFTENLFISDDYGYSASVYNGERSTIDADVCEVWGKDLRELNNRLNLISKAPDQEKEIAKLKAALIKTDQAYKKFFEFTWDTDPDYTTEEERNHYRNILVELSELGGSIEGHYEHLIEEEENKLPFERNPDDDRDFKMDR